ncbi:MAG: hypothetical protein MHM6MM_006136 [Cercozoa sp. M6MM]
MQTTDDNLSDFAEVQFETGSSCSSEWDRMSDNPSADLTGSEHDGVDVADDGSDHLSKSVVSELAAFGTEESGSDRDSSVRSETEMHSGKQSPGPSFILTDDEADVNAPPPTLVPPSPVSAHVSARTSAGVACGHVELMSNSMPSQVTQLLRAAITQIGQLQRQLAAANVESQLRHQQSMAETHALRQEVTVLKKQLRHLKPAKTVAKHVVKQIRKRSSRRELSKRRNKMRVVLREVIRRVQRKNAALKKSDTTNAVTPQHKSLNCAVSKPLKKVFDAVVSDVRPASRRSHTRVRARAATVALGKVHEMSLRRAKCAKAAETALRVAEEEAAVLARESHGASLLVSTKESKVVHARSGLAHTNQLLNAALANHKTAQEQLKSKFINWKGRSKVTRRMTRIHDDLKISRAHVAFYNSQRVSLVDTVRKCVQEHEGALLALEEAKQRERAALGKVELSKRIHQTAEKSSFAGQVCTTLSRRIAFCSVAAECAASAMLKLHSQIRECTVTQLTPDEESTRVPSEPLTLQALLDTERRSERTRRRVARRRQRALRRKLRRSYRHQAAALHKYLTRGYKKRASRLHQHCHYF